MKIEIFTGYTEREVSNIESSKYTPFRGLILYPERIGHPKFVTDYIYRMILSSKEKKLEYIAIATLSKTVINFIGLMINKGILNHEDIKIYVTIKDEIKECSYDEEGYLNEGWPIGFFNVDIDRLIEKYKERYDIDE